MVSYVLTLPATSISGILHDYTLSNAILRYTPENLPLLMINYYCREFLSTILCFEAKAGFLFTLFISLDSLFLGYSFRHKRFKLQVEASLLIEVL